MAKRTLHGRNVSDNLGSDVVDSEEYLEETATQNKQKQPRIDSFREKLTFKGLGCSATLTVGSPVDETFPCLTSYLPQGAVDAQEYTLTTEENGVDACSESREQRQGIQDGIERLEKSTQCDGLLEIGADANDHPNLNQDNKVNQRQDAISQEENYLIGNESPCGSLSSCASSAIYRVELQPIGLDPSTLKLQNAMSNPKLVMDETSRDNLKLITRDPNFKRRFKQFLLHDAKSVLISSGKELEDPDLKEFVKQVEDMNENELLANFGKTVLEDFVSQTQSNDDIELLKPEQTNHKETEQIDPKFVDSAKYCEIHEHNMSKLKTQSEQNHTTYEMAGVSVSKYPLDSVTPSLVKHVKVEPEFDVTEIDKLPIASSSAVDYQYQGITVADEIWENAYDKIKHPRAVEKMGQVLFDAVFSKNEIIECNSSGKKQKGKKFRCFDSSKVRFVKSGVAWLKTNPIERSQREFQSSMTTNRHRLTEDKDDVDIKKVFTEFAYRRRKELTKTTA